MALTDTLRTWKKLISAELHSARGKDVLLYLLFVCVAFVFWLMLSLDSEVQRDYDVPLVIDDVPDSVTFITAMPATVNVGVQAKGSQLLQYAWGHIAPVKFSFREFASENVWAVTTAKMESRMRDYFGNGVMINSVRPDSLRLVYTTLPGEKVKLHIQGSVTTNLEYVQSGPLSANVDSIAVYSRHPLPHDLKIVETEPFVCRDLRDTTYVEVRLTPIAGMRFIPDRVRVCVPVEALVMKKQMVRIEAVNVPEGSALITFPSKAEVSFLVPVSRYKDDDELRVFADYNDIRRGSQYLPLHMSLMPSDIRQASVAPDSVEYIIDR